ncbi:hypothetical protein [Curtobacterium pusillum]|uniref:hypothetical protein n=1 Tax=Curtobacterium pusillum TaxID=69373 RepID=UPI001584E864|nr:hypothetical protein [Curtobacterium pusillum]
MRRSTSTVRRACAVGTTAALVALTTGLGIATATAAHADTVSTLSAPADPQPQDTTGTDAGIGTGSDETGTGTGTGTGTDETGTVTGTGTGTGTDGDTTTDAASGGSGAAPVTGTGSDATGPTDGSGTGSGVDTDQTTTTDGGTTAPSNTVRRTTDATSESGTSTTEVAAKTVKIAGAVKVGVTLRAETTGFAAPHTYAWTRDGDTTVLSIDESYTLTEDDVDHVMTLTVTDSATSTAISATSEKVSQDVAFADADTNSVDAPLTFTEDAGVAYSHSFAVAEGSGTVTYSIGYSYPEDVDPSDSDDQPESYLPDGVQFDPTTGVLRGESISAGDYEFTVVATNGTSSATEYVSITVNPDVAVGVLAFTSDTSNDDIFNETKASNAWIIEPDGTITTVHRPADLDADPTIEFGGQPTVKQGQSLWIQGFSVDQYGNPTADFDEETGDLPQPVVTSDVATDQIAWDDDEYAVRVTFPHASTHHLTVAQDGASVRFPVTVVPTAATVTTIASTPTGTTGTTGRQLAYTGSDATGALPWALGLVLAGVGLIGARTLRRRHAQR